MIYRRFAADSGHRWVIFSFLSSSGDDVIELQLLGQAGARVDGTEFPIATRKALGLLTHLSLEGASPRGMLATLLWPDQTDDAARTNLRQELRRLRGTPFGASLKTVVDTLSLEPKPCTDVDRFRAALQAGDLERAVACYAGPLLANMDFSVAPDFEDWLRAQRERLALEHRQALSELAVGREQSGDLRGALAAVLVLLETDALQEAAHRQAMRLHALLGEREAALDRFERCCQVLRDELALEPLAETVRLAGQIRAGSVAVQVLTSAPVASGLELGHDPLREPPLVGRDLAWQDLEQAHGLSLIVAESGVGKSRLALEFARSHGRTLVLGAQELAQGTPLAPFADGLREAQRNGWLEGLQAIWQRELVRLLPELGSGAIPDLNATPEGRARFLEGLLQALKACNAVTIVLDDLHWFDVTSLEVITRLALESQSSHGLRLIATARPHELLENIAARKLLETLERRSSMTRLELEPLSEPELLGLVRALSGSDEGERFANRLHAVTAGNPLFVLETLRSLRESGELDVRQPWQTRYDETTEDYAELPVTGSVREAVLRRVDHLGAQARRILEAASLCGERFTLEELSGATALNEFSSLEALEQSSAAGLIRCEARGHRFSHDLIRRALSDSLSPERARLLHRRIAGSLEQLRAAPERIADHLERALEPERATRWWLEAAKTAETVFAYEDALRCYARALGHLCGREAFEVHWSRAKLCRAVHDRQEWAQCVAKMLELTHSPDQPALADANLRVRAELAQSELEFDRGDFVRALERVSPLLDWNLQAHTATQVRLQVGNALLRLGHPEQADTVLRAGLELAPTQLLRGNLRTSLAACAAQRQDYDQVEAHNTAALAAFRAVGHVIGEARVLLSMAQLATLESDGVQAHSALEQALLLARSVGHVPVQRAVRLELARAALLLEQPEAALEQVQHGFGLQDDEPSVYRLMLLNYASIAHKLLGHFATALDVGGQALRLAQSLAMPQMELAQRQMLAELEWICGDAQAAQVWLEPILEDALSQLILARIDLAHEPARAMVRLERLLLEPELTDADLSLVMYLYGEALLLLPHDERPFPTACLEHLPSLRAKSCRLRLLLALRNRTLNHELSDSELLDEADDLLHFGQVPASEWLELAWTFLAVLQAYDLLKLHPSQPEWIETQVNQLAALLEPHRWALFWAQQRHSQEIVQRIYCDQHNTFDHKSKFDQGKRDAAPMLNPDSKYKGEKRGTTWHTKPNSG
jgi:DNA-binding SARP family transcriptional activator/tetratricopeptide (TPR) repeat protein